MISLNFAPCSLNALLCVMLLGLPGCSKREQADANPSPAKVVAGSVDVCRILTPEEFERILGERPARTQKTENTNSGLTISQCSFQMRTLSNSISVSVARRAPGADGRDPKTFLEEKIEQRERAGGEEEEQEKPLDFVAGVGDKAIWMGTSVGGTLYVLKDNLFVSIGLGTSNEPAKRKENAVKIATLLLERM